MSQFTVCVITPEYPSDDVLSAALQPFHEYECTGVDDEYVQTINITEQAREEYLSSTSRCVRAPDGKLRSAFDDCFYRDPTPEEAEQIGLGSGRRGDLCWYSRDWGDGRGYRARVRYVPDGHEEVMVPTSEVESFPEWVDGYYGIQAVRHDEDLDRENAHKYGWCRLAPPADEAVTRFQIITEDEFGERPDLTACVIEVIDRTNPNKKWDGWVVGGRWSGRLLVRDGAQGWRGRRRSDSDGYDVGRKGDLDLEAMRLKNVENRHHDVEEAIRVVTDTSGLSLGQVVDAWAAYVTTLPTTRVEWKTGPSSHLPFYDYITTLPADHPVRMARELKLLGWDCLGNVVPETEPDPRTWANAAPALTSHAFLRDGQWCERGKMGWWAIVTDEKEGWEEQFSALLAEVPDDHYVTIVDCHI